MAELRSVDPRTIPTTSRTSPWPDKDAQLLASIRAIGNIQPPFVTAARTGS